jgi:hypothetical protein
MGSNSCIQAPLLVDDTQHWCKHCVALHASSGKAASMTKYALRTSTGTLGEHLCITHEIDLHSSVCTVIYAAQSKFLILLEFFTACPENTQNTDL